MARKWTNSKGINHFTDVRKERELDKLRRELIRRPNRGGGNRYNNKNNKRRKRR